MENSTADYTYIDRNLARVRERIAAACREAGRDPSEVTLLAAVKYADADEVNHLLSLGVTDIGENRVQQLLDRYDKLERKEDTRVHFIGTLQTNKVKYLMGKVSMIHSLDSLKLAAEIDRQSKKYGIVTDVLVEINSGHEESKSGVAPEEAEALCRVLADYPNLHLAGFMTMAPRCTASEEYRKYFRETFALCLDIWSKRLHNKMRPVMSMGMSDSFEEAILEGATIVRVGRGLFVKDTETC